MPVVSCTDVLWVGVLFQTINGVPVNPDAQVLESLFQLVLFFLVVLVALAFNHTVRLSLISPHGQSLFRDTSTLNASYCYCFQCE